MEGGAVPEWNYQYLLPELEAIAAAEGCEEWVITSFQQGGSCDEWDMRRRKECGGGGAGRLGG